MVNSFWPFVMWDTSFGPRFTWLTNSFLLSFYVDFGKIIGKRIMFVMKFQRYQARVVAKNFANHWFRIKALLRLAKAWVQFLCPPTKWFWSDGSQEKSMFPTFIWCVGVAHDLRIVPWSTRNIWYVVTRTQDRAQYERSQQRGWRL